MAQITLDIPNNVISRVIDAVCAQQGYEAEIDDGAGNMIPNPQTKAQFAKQFLIRVIMQNVKNYEADLAEEQVTPQRLREDAISKVEAEVNIT